MRIKQALKFALLNGKDSTSVRQKIADRIWGNSSKESKEVNISNLVRGKTVNFKESHIVAICEEAGVSPDFLFGYNKETKSFNFEQDL